MGRRRTGFAVRRLSWGLALVGAVLLAGQGCGSRSGGPSKVAQSELYRSGNPQYDDFFEDVYNVQQESKPAADDEKSARTALGDVAGKSDSIDDLLSAVKRRAEALAGGKTKMHLEVDGCDDQGRPEVGKTIAVRAQKGRAVPKDQADFVSALEASLRAEGKIWEKYSPLADKSRRLLASAKDLDAHVDEQFSSKKDRAQVRDELGASKSSLATIGETLDRVVSDSTRFSKGVSEALSHATGQGETRDRDRPKAKEPKEKDEKPKGRARSWSQDSSKEGRPKKTEGASKRASPDGEKAGEPAKSAAPAVEAHPSSPPAGTDFNP